MRYKLCFKFISRPPPTPGWMLMMMSFIMDSNWQSFYCSGDLFTAVRMPMDPSRSDNVKGKILKAFSETLRTFFIAQSSMVCGKIYFVANLNNLIYLIVPRMNQISVLIPPLKRLAN